MKKHPHPRFFSLFAGLCALAVLAGGCAGPPPRMLSVNPQRVEQEQDGQKIAWYDTDNDGKPDFRETLNSEGRIVALGYDTDADGEIDDTVELDRVPPAEQRHLVLLLDSIPWELVDEFWRQGRFRFFPRPGRVFAPFPVMTDTSFATFFGETPIPGVESAYYDATRNRLTNGYDTYAGRGNVPWQNHVDYVLNPVLHSVAYLKAEPWFAHELGHIQREFERSDRPVFVGYVVGTSALGALNGRAGHVHGLLTLDRFCHAVMHQSRGRARITLLSDHGHNLVKSPRIPLSETLAQLGYRVTDRLERPEDIILPEFGIVTCAAIHTRIPARVAADAVQIEGVEHGFYMDGGELVVLRHDGRARIARSGDRYRYSVDRGDPLLLLPIIERLKDEGKVDAGGFIADADWFVATQDHVYPDVPHRLWRSFHGLVRNQPDILLSIHDGYHAGSKFMTRMIDLAAAHGNIRPLSSTAFVMTMAGELPPVQRMEDLRAALNRIGVPVGGKPAGEAASPAMTRAVFSADPPRDFHPDSTTRFPPDEHDPHTIIH